MAVTSKNLRSAQRVAQAAPALGERFQLGLYVVTLLLAAVALYGVIGLFIGRASILIDDLRYGRPRTYQVEAYVNHGDAPGRPTHLLALNLILEHMFKVNASEDLYKRTFRLWNAA